MSYEHINLGRCLQCGIAPRHVNADGICMACEFIGNVTAAYPKSESYVRPDGITVLDMSRVDLFGKP